MSTSWETIRILELNEKYVDVIHALEERLRIDPSETEAVIRLGFNYWLAIAENDRLHLNIPVEKYATRFIQLLDTYEKEMGENPDFCFSFGLGLSMDYYNFVPKSDEAMLERFKQRGEALMVRAASSDDFYKRFNEQKATQEDLTNKFKGRGCFEKYYNIT